MSGRLPFSVSFQVLKKDRETKKENPVAEKMEMLSERRKEERLSLQMRAGKGDTTPNVFTSFKGFRSGGGVNWQACTFKMVRSHRRLACCVNSFWQKDFFKIISSVESVYFWIICSSGWFHSAHTGVQLRTKNREMCVGKQKLFNTLTSCSWFRVESLSESTLQRTKVTSMRSSS